MSEEQYVSYGIAELLKDRGFDWDCLVGMIVTRNHEKKEYNNGICPKCGGNLRYFDSDSQGGRGYNCDKCNNFVWVSYNVDKPRKE